MTGGVDVRDAVAAAEYTAARWEVLNAELEAAAELEERRKDASAAEPHQPSGHELHRCVFPPAPDLETAIWGPWTDADCLIGTGVRLPDGYADTICHHASDGHRTCQPQYVRMPRRAA